MSVESPCIKLRKFDDATGYSKGWLRTRKQCKVWKVLKNKKRRKIIAAPPDGSVAQ